MPEPKPSSSRLPSATLAVVLAAFILVPIYVATRHQACGDRTLRCATQLVWIVAGLHAYADEHGGALPPPGDAWADLLIEGGFVPAEMFLSPSAWEEYDRSSYAYVPADHLDPTGGQVLLYEVAGLHPESGVHIAYHDGRVETLAAEDAAKIIASLESSNNPPSRPQVDPDAAVRPVPDL